MQKWYRILGKKGRITIPYEIREHVGFTYNDVLSFTESEDGCAVTVRREKICDHCSGGKSQAHEEVTLLEFLNRLTEEQQQAALIHLSVKWAEKKALDAQKEGGIPDGWT